MRERDGPKGRHGKNRKGRALLGASEQCRQSEWFTDHVEERWYLCRSIDPWVTLNISIDKTTGDYEEHVLDEGSGQPFPYGRYPEANRLRTVIDSVLSDLRGAGLEVTVNHTLYGCAPSPA